MTEAPATDLVRLPPEAIAQLRPVDTGTIGQDEFERLWRIGVGLAKSGMFKDISQAEQAFAKILLGRDLGLSPAQSLGAIYFVKGNLQIAAVTLASFVRRHEHYDYRIRDHDREHCVIEFWRERDGDEGDLLGVSEFSIQDAKDAGIYDARSAWGAHPRNMVFARAMSNGVRWYCPDLLGGIPVYTEGDTFDSTAEDITATDDAKATTHEFPPEVEAVLVRAREAGHNALANREAAALATGGQPQDVIDAWVQGAKLELDALAPPDAEVVRHPELEGIAAAGLRLGEVKQEISEAEAAGDDERLADLLVERDQLAEVLAGEPDDPTVPS